MPGKDNGKGKGDSEYYATGKGAKIPDRYVAFTATNGEPVSVNPYSVVGIRGYEDGSCTLYTDGGHTFDVSESAAVAEARLVGDSVE